MFYKLSGFLILVRRFIRMFCRVCESQEQFLSNVSGEVSKGNFSYYSMTYDGTILLELISTLGDCDLYISQNTLKPNYEPELNCLQSATCGTDTITVPKSFKRPIGIGIFGHPSHEVSAYHLLFYRIDDSRDIFNYDPYSETLQSHLNKKHKDYNRKSKTYGVEEEEEESIFWILLRSFLAFLIEIIL